MTNGVVKRFFVFLSVLSLMLLFLGCSSKNNGSTTSQANNTPSTACFNQFHAGNYQVAVQYGKKAVREYPSNPKAYFCLGAAYAKTGQIDKAIESLTKASRYTSDDHLLMHIYNWLGVEYLRKGDYTNAILYESKSLKLAKRFGDVEFERNAFINMGVISQNEGNNYKALEYYKKALELGNIESGVLYNNIALIYLSVGNYKKAIEYFKKAINVAEENGHFLKSGEWILNLGNAYRIAKDYKNGKFYLEKGLERVKKAGNKRWEALGYTYFGLYYKDTDNKALAKEYLTKAYDIFKAIGDDRGASVVMHYLSSIK